MAKRFTDSDKFKDTWYRKLKPKQKCIWEYLLAECNHAGIIELDLEYASFVIGETVTKDDLIPFENKVKHLEKELYYIPNFIEFQYGKLSRLCKPHLPVIKLLEKYNIPFDLLDENELDTNRIRQRLTSKAKENVLIRDKYECQYCGSHDFLEVDHIIPISKGGTNQEDNLITACSRCNNLKRDLSLKEFVEKNKDKINFLDRVYKKLDTLKEKEKEKEQDKDKEINTKLYGEYSNVCLTKQQHQKLLSICLSEKLLNELINSFSVAIEVGKERPYTADLPNAHYERLKSYYNYRKRNPDKFRDDVDNNDAIFERLRQKWEKKEVGDANMGIC